MNEQLKHIAEWEIREDSFCPESPAFAKEAKKNESLFSQGNGFLGFRGNLEEGSPFGVEGTYLNGFYEQERIQYGEIAYGYAENGQTMLNVANGKRLRLWVGGEEFSMLNGMVREYTRALSMKSGLLSRSLIWVSPSGWEVKLEFERVVCFRRPGIAAVRCRVTPLSGPVEVRFESVIDGSVTNLKTENDPRVGSGLKGKPLTTTDYHADGNDAQLAQHTKNSGLALACAMRNECGGAAFTGKTEGESVACGCVASVAQSETVRFVKYLAYTRGRAGEEAGLLAEASRLAAEAANAGFDALAAEQAEYLAGFWENADVQVDGDTALLQGVRFNMFHLLQSAGRDGVTNIAAKGLTGEGYEGHYFWDTETYVLPMMTCCAPDVARQLLLYRYSILDNARNRARQMGHPRGALFPWRTIGGDECSAYYPAGTAQYHINADIAFAVERYVAYTGDEAFLADYGAEMLAETARLWADLGFYDSGKGGRFCLNGVTGPDEYNAIVDNNCYTNLMAKENMVYAVRVLALLQEKYPEKYHALTVKIGLESGEPAEWQRAADAMYVPYDEESGIYPQDDGFLDRVPWNLDSIPKENFPLLLHYHPLVIYRHQVCKQADLILSMLLLPGQFTAEEKRRNFFFYDKVTTHDSSLSMAVFSILAAEIGEADKAYEYFSHTARFDLDDFHGNTGDGLHMANMAGTWMGIVQGFAGMRLIGEELSFHPTLPEAWKGYRFRMGWHGSVIELHVTREGTEYRLVSGQSVTVHENGKRIEIC